MNTHCPAPRIASVRVTDDAIVTELTDGRVIRFPIARSWRLSDATPEQRAHVRIVGAGHVVHWPDVEEDLSVTGMLRRIPATRVRPRAARTARG